MRLSNTLAMIRSWFGVEPPAPPPAAMPRADTTGPDERKQIDERLTRQQAALADLLASASLDELRNRSQPPHAP